MKKLLITIAALLVIAGLVFVVMGGKEGLVETVLPTMPDFPEPKASLSADDSGTLYFKSHTPFDFDVLLNDPKIGMPMTGVGDLYLPEGASEQNPVPAMIVLHGSGGISPGRERETAEHIVANGFAAFVIDYYKSRGVTEETPYMISVVSITEFDAVADGYGALQMLSGHPAIQADQIGLMGFSYGGMATRIGMDERVRRRLAPSLKGFAAFVDYYGPCFQVLGTTNTNGSPLLTLRGTEDNSNHLPSCLKREAEIQALGVSVEPHVFEGAGHAWDNHNPRALKEDAPFLGGNCEMVYDAEGYPQALGQYVVKPPMGTSRAERIALRMESGTVLADCVGYGYIVGRDDKTRSRTDNLLIDFLQRNLMAEKK